MSATNYTERVNQTSAQTVNRPFLSGRSQGIDDIQAWTKFFGPPPRKQQNFGEDISETHHDLYKIYEGQNLYLADTITGLVLADNSWETSVFPWVETDQMHVSFSRFEFKNTLATPVPYEGIPRLITSSSSTFADSVHRLGIAFIMEADALSTPEGQNLYNNNLVQITMASTNAIKYAVIVKLLVCKDYERERQDLHRNNGKTTERIEQLECEYFGVLSVNREGFPRMIEDYITTMKSHNVVPDTLIMFPRFQQFNELVNMGTYTEYLQTGPDGIAFLREGPVASGMYRGKLVVYETQEFSAYTNGLRFQPLLRRVTFGEFYPMTFGQWRGTVLPPSFSNDWRTLRIYDIRSNSWAKVDFLSAFKRAYLFGNSQRDPNGLHPNVDKLATVYNEQFKDDFSAEGERYAAENLYKLDNLDGDSNPARRYFFMLAFDADKHTVSKVKRFEQFDIDVINTSDFEQSAQTLIYRAFPSEDDRANMRARLNNLKKLVDLLEAQPYSATFAQAIATENAPESIDANGVFRGFQQTSSDVIDWVGNEFDSLDLPAAATGGVQIPVVGATYGSIATLAQQGKERGYDAAATALAVEGAETIRELVRNHNEVIPNTAALGPDNVPAWFNKKLSEEAAFGILFPRRPPLFLAVASNEVGNAAVTGAPPARPAKSTTSGGAGAGGVRPAEKTKIVWNPLGNTAGTAVLFPDVFSRVRFIDALIRATPASTLATLAADLAGATAAPAATALDTFLFNLISTAVSKLPATATQADKDAAVNAAEAARTSIVDALMAMLKKATKAEQMPDVVKQLKDVVAKMPQTPADATVEKAADQVAAINAAARDAAKNANAYIASLTQQQAADNAAYGTVLKSFEVGTGVPLNRSGNPPNRSPVLPMIMEALPTIQHQLSASVGNKRGSKNILQIAADLNEKLESIGRSFYAQTKLLLTAETYANWVDEVTRKDLLSQEQRDTVAAAYSNYSKILDEIEARASTTFNDFHAAKAASSSSSAVDVDADADFDDAGSKVFDAGRGKKTGAPNIWIRSPLVNYPKLMQSLAQQATMPLMLPSDPRSAYRTVYAPWAKDGQVEITLNDFTTISEDANMGRVTATSLKSAVKPFEKEPRVSSLLVREPLEKFFVEDEAAVRFTASGHPVIGLVGARPDEDFDVNEIRANATRERAVHFGDALETEANAVSERMLEINRQRMLAGRPSRNFDRDLASAAASAEQRDRASAQQQAEMEAAAELDQFGATPAGAAYSFGTTAMRTGAGMVLDPIARAQQFSSSIESAGRRSMMPSGARQASASTFRPGRLTQLDIDLNAREQEREDEERRELEYEERDYMAADPRYFADYQWTAATGGRGYVPQGYYAGEFGIDPNNPTYGLQGTYARDLRYFNRRGTGPRRPDRAWPGQAAPPPAQATDEYADAKHPNAEYRHRKAYEHTDPLERFAMLLLMQLPNTYPTWLNLIKKQVHVPINLIVWRSITLEMFTALLLQSGIETGANIVGKAAAAMSGSVADRMVYATYIFHHAFMVFNEKGVNHLQNVQFGGYIAGLDMTWVTTKKELKEDVRGSLIVTAIPITENQLPARLNFVDTTAARLLPSQTNRTKDIDPVPDYSSARFYQEMWGLNEQFLNHTRATNRYHTQSQRVNVRYSQGKHYSHSGPSNVYVLHKGDGQLAGKKMGPHAKSVLLGTNTEMLPLDDPDAQTRVF